MTKKTTDHLCTSSSCLLPLVRVLFVVNSMIWLGHGVVRLVQLRPVSHELGIMPLIVPTLMFGNAAALLLASICISKKRYFFFYFAIVLLFLNILVIAVDNLQVHDLIALLFDMLLLALLPMLPPWSEQRPLLFEY